MGDLASSPILGYSDATALRTDPTRGVALDLGMVGRKKTPPGFIRSLPRFPVRALGLRSHGLRQVPAEVLALDRLEVLSLRDCRITGPLDGLDRLRRLRALDLTGNSSPVLYSPALLDLPALEVLDFRRWPDDRLPACLYDRPLRHLDLVAARRLPDDLDRFPLESLVMTSFTRFDPDMFARLPLRYLEFLGGHLELLPAHPTLTHLALSPAPEDAPPALPESIRAMPELRALQLRGAVRELPDWPALRRLRVLRVDAHLEGRWEWLRAVERMTELRVLVLNLYDVAALPLDLSALRHLEVLGVNCDRMTRYEDLPRGIDGLPRLREFTYGSPWDPAEGDRIVAAVPTAVRGNGFRSWGAGPFYRATRPRGSVEWYLARFGEGEHWYDLSGTAD